MSLSIQASFRSPEALAFAAIVEAVAMFVGAFVSRTPDIEEDVSLPFTLMTEYARLEIAQCENDVFTIHGWAVPNFTQQAFSQFYVLVAGLRRAGLVVDCSGEYAPFLPQEESMALCSTLLFKRIGFDHDSKSSKDLQFTPSQLVQLHSHFNSISNLKQANESSLYPGRYMSSERCFVWKLPGSAMVKAKVKGDQLIDHQILGFTVPAKAFQKGLQLTHAVCRRTWGEAWLPHERAEQILTGLIRMEDEVAIITDQIYRYQIEDHSSIIFRRLTFGKGPSKSFLFDEWLQFARHFHSKKNSRVAMLCLKQAELLAVTHEQKMNVANRRSVFRPPRRIRVPKSKELRQRKLQELESWIGNESLAKVITIENGRSEAFAYSDYGRVPWEVPQAENQPVESQIAKDAGMTQEILQHLLNCKRFSFFPDKIAGLFSFAVDGRRIWGGRDTGVYYVEGIFDTIFAN